METYKVHENGISPGEVPVRLVNNETVWNISPSTDTGVSPVAELSVNLQNLRCNDGADEIRRKLPFSPEQLTPSTPETTSVLSSGRRLSLLGEVTPTGNILTESGSRRGERFVSPECSPPKMKRLRVKLSTRFRSTSSVQRSDPGVRGHMGQCHMSPPRGEGGTVRRGDVVLSDVEALLSIRKVHFRRRPFSPRSILGSMMENRTLIGDYSKPLLLPVERDDNQGLHCISSSTVASLLRGQYNGAVDGFLIIDCRYPYEYCGGHITGAVNLHTEAQLQGALLQLPALYQGTSTPEGGSLSPEQVSPLEGSSPRKLIVFHCEFSSERGPRLCHYLRELDRAINASLYPLLFYPELYLLEGGYRRFYACYPELCEPRGYVPMLHGDHRHQLRRLRWKTKSRLCKRRTLYQTH
ncbi:hypothetical protein UPYG_G00059660 [Umbra pygmaea]|uniref:M-phase inducer phosphatase n=1 Tax=Umbra pygmaea TaxID=75934 RepID=A0ABD0X925_UMBPY